MKETKFILKFCVNRKNTFRGFWQFKSMAFKCLNSLSLSSPLSSGNIVMIIIFP